MEFFGHDIQFEYAIYDPNSDESEEIYRFDTPEAVEAFIHEKMNKEKYKGYKGCLQPVYDGERDDSSFIRTFECPIVPLSFTEKVVFLNNYILGAGLDGEFWPTSPLVRIL